MKSNTSYENSALSVASCEKADVTAENVDQVFHAFNFPFPAKKDTVSHPVKAWKMARALDFSGPRQVAIAWEAII